MGNNIFWRADINALRNPLLIIYSGVHGTRYEICSYYNGSTVMIHTSKGINIVFISSTTAAVLAGDCR